MSKRGRFSSESVDTAETESPKNVVRQRIRRVRRRQAHPSQDVPSEKEKTLKVVVIRDDQLAAQRTMKSTPSHPPSRASGKMRQKA